MVSNMLISELLSIEKLDERNHQLRHAFAPYTSMLVVDGEEPLTIVVLLNLTSKKTDKSDLCDYPIAKKIVADDEFLDSCIKEVQWLHSHNLKYPDSRVSDQKMILTSPEIIHGCATSAGETAVMGWSHNSSDVNRAKLFCSSFSWRGEVTNLARLIKDGDAVWRRCFENLGLSDQRMALVEQKMLEYLPSNTTPLEVSPFSKQVRMPFKNGYCAVTPVVSHALQCKVQRLVISQSLPNSTLRHAHPASIGDLVASVGGKIRFLQSFPRVQKTDYTLHPQYRDRQSESPQVLYKFAITNKRFLSKLRLLLNVSSFSTKRLRKRKRVGALSSIKLAILEWLEPLLESRKGLDESGKKIEEVNLHPGELEYIFLTTPYDQMIEITGLLNVRFHEELQRNVRGREFAFHPKLMAAIRTQIEYVLAHIADIAKQPDLECREDRSYIHFSDLKVQGADIVSSPYLMGMPSLTALWGFTHNFELKLRKLSGRNISIIGAAWFIKKLDTNWDAKLPEPMNCVKLRQQSDIRRPGIRSSIYCDITMDLVMIVKSIDGEKTVSTQDMTLVQAAFPSRFAGGCLLPPAVSEQTNWLNIYQNKDEAFNKLSRMPRNGCWIYPVDTSSSSLDEMLQQVVSEANYRLASIGYAALEEPRFREGSIEHLHCFAENALGLVNCVKPIEVKYAGSRQFFNSAFWQIQIQNRSMLIKRALVGADE